MKSTPEILAGLLKLKVMSNKLHDDLHDQEHLYEAMEYNELMEVFDECNRDVWDYLHHRFLRRLYDLGGRPPGTPDDIAAAYKRALDGFGELHAECQQFYQILDTDEPGEDYVTKKMLMKTQRRIEKWINYFEAKAAQVQYLGAKQFMTEQID